MVEKRKSGKSDKPNSTDGEGLPDAAPNAGGLAASLDALMSIAEKGEKRAEGDIVRLETRSQGERKNKPRPTRKKAPARSAASRRKKPQITQDKAPSKEDVEPLGVVELLSALKSDIDSLRQDNEEFKAQLISSSAHKNTSTGEGGEGTELRGLLEALKADIGNLRNENDSLRSQAFAAEDTAPPAQSEDQELYGMLAELKADITSLRTENESLRAGKMVPAPARSTGSNDEVAMMLHDLKSDITDLKHDNEALRIENRTARDGAHFENLGGQQGAYRNTGNDLVSGLLKGIGALSLVLVAAGGGYYLAQSNAGVAPSVGRSAPVTSPITSLGSQQPLPVQPVQRPSVAKPAVAVVKPVEAPAKLEVAKTPPKAKIVQPKTAAPQIIVSTDVETAMMARASGLMDARDIGAARMVFVYLARHGSAAAMTRLAQTYDPDFLVDQGFDEGKNSDLGRAKRLYGAASGMGDTEAETRLLEMQ